MRDSPFPLRVALLSAFPPLACGVADCSARLADALEREGATVLRIRSDHWAPRDLGRLRRARAAAEVAHLQYPTQESRVSLTPHLLSLLPGRTPLVVTVHDISVMHAIRRWSCLAFTSAAWLIFTTEAERVAAARMAPWIERRCSVIPIGSNLPRGRIAPKKVPGLVAYFGLFRPNKGLEDFLKAAHLSRQQNLPFRFVAIGREQSDRAGYLDLARRLPGAGAVEWRIDLGPDAASAALSEAEFAYLPFPDGVSERRGSLMAAISSGAAVVTTRGPQTPAELTACVRFAGGPASAIEEMKTLRSEPMLREGLRVAAARYLARRDWSVIADAHIALYRGLCARPTGTPLPHR